MSLNSVDYHISDDSIIISQGIFHGEYSIGIDTFTNQLFTKNWLKGNVFDTYVRRIMNGKDWYFVDTDACNKLFDSEASSEIETFKAELVLKQKIIFSLRRGQHYFVVSVEQSGRWPRIWIYDSLKNDRSFIHDPIALQTCRILGIDEDPWTYRMRNMDCPTQNDSYSCGYFAIHFIESIIGRTALSPFGVSEVTELRKNIFKSLAPSQPTPVSISDPDGDTSTQDSLSPRSDDTALPPGESSKKTKSESVRGKITSEDWDLLPQMRLHRLREDKFGELKKGRDNPLEKQLGEILNLKTTKKFTFKEKVQLYNFKGYAYIFSRISEGDRDRVHNHFGIEEISTSITSTVVFIPCGKTYYVLTSGNAWETVLSLVDYEFQSKVPERILDEDGVNCYSVTPILGCLRKRSQESKTKLSLRELNLGDICQSYEGSLQPTIGQKLFPAQSSSKGGKEKEIKASISVGGIKFHIFARFEELTRAIFKLEATYQKALENPLEKPTAISQLMLKTDKTVSAELTQELITCLETAMQTSDYSSQYIQEFDVFPSKSTEFTLADTVQVCLDQKLRAGSDILQNPSLSDVLAAAVELNNGEAIPTGFMKKLHLAHSFNGNEVILPLIRQLLGQFYSEKYKKTFFMAHGWWYEITEGFVIRVQQEFQKILKDHLIPHGGATSLQKRWPHYINSEGEYKQAITETEYNRRMWTFGNDFFVGGYITPYNIELFDIAFVPDKGNYCYLYHVKHGFSSTSTSVACAQLLRSAEFFKGYESSKKKKILNAYQKQFETHPHCVIQRDNFLSMTGLSGNDRRESVFVLSLLTNERLVVPVPSGTKIPPDLTNLSQKATSRSLQLEKLVILKFSKGQFSDRLREKEFLAECIGCNISEVSDKILQGLVANRFISTSKNSNKYQVLPKLLLNPAMNSFDFLFVNPRLTTVEKTDACRILCLYLQRYMTYFKSLGTKMDIVRTCKEMQSNSTFKTFRICEVISENVAEKDELKTAPKKEK